MHRGKGIRGRVSVCLFITLACVVLWAGACWGAYWPGPKPGKARACEADGAWTLDNDVLRVSWRVSGGRLCPDSVGNKMRGSQWSQGGRRLFTLGVKGEGGERLVGSDEFEVIDGPAVEAVSAEKGSLSLAGRVAGQRLAALLRHEALGLEVLWQAQMRDGSNYVREVFTFGGGEGRVALSSVELMGRSMKHGRQVGTVPGSPVAAGEMFFGVELPFTQNQIDEDGFRITFPCQLEVGGEQEYRFSSVTGVYPSGQLRRGFLCYLDQERASPYRPFLHYNCWYDLGNNPTAESLEKVIEAFDEHFIRKYGIEVQSFVIDDGWDDYEQGLWQVDEKKFPGGFGPMKAALEKVGSHLGIWISPLGGYNESVQRLARAREAGVVSGGFDLSKPGYYEWFRDKCASLMKDYGVNYFKWDRAGAGVGAHFMALLRVARELRKQNPSLFINTTVGTWPSPFWLNYVDSIWRNGADVSWIGKGDDREQWLTYRDSECYHGNVTQGPLFPINSLMLCSIVHGRHYQAVRTSQAGNDLEHEARSYFAYGPNLQELYLTPEMMGPASWAQVAEAKQWYDKHVELMCDTHWVGGDPRALEVYGWAGWSPGGAYVALRNPDDTARSVALDAQEVFELPADAARVYRCERAYADQRVETIVLRAGVKETLELEPFEVLVFDATIRD